MMGYVAETLSNKQHRRLSCLVTEIHSKTFFRFRGIVDNSEQYFIFKWDMCIASGGFMVGKPGARLKMGPLIMSFYSANRDTTFD